MQKAALKHSPAETLELIKAQLAELRQTEALEAQIHEMVVSKRHRLDVLMTQFLEMQALPPAPLAAPLAAVPGIPVPVAPVPVAPVPVAPVPVAPVEPFVPAETVVPRPELTEAPEEPMKLTHLGTGGAPTDLLAARAPVGPRPGAQSAQSAPSAPPAPSAQQVLDSLNRLMAGLKEISAKQGPVN
jgi:hypothetical protein